MSEPLPKEKLACSGYRWDRVFCAHGFPQTSACWGSGTTPICCQETVCARLFPETGKPERFIEVRSLTKEMIDQQARQLLRDVAAHFRDNPDTWTQGFGARDAGGNAIGYKSPLAVQRCIDGELCLREDGTPVYHAAASLLKRHLKTSLFSKWNDEEGRTVDEVIAACEGAAQS